MLSRECEGTERDGKMSHKRDLNPHQVLTGRELEIWCYNHAKTLDFYVQEKGRAVPVNFRLPKKKLAKLAELQ